MTTAQWILAWVLYLMATFWGTRRFSVYVILYTVRVDWEQVVWMMIFWIGLGGFVTWLLA